MIRRALVVLVLVVCAGPVAAQSPPPPRLEFFPRAALRLGAEFLGSDDPRFVWDTNFGGDLDVLSYGSTRLTFRTNYQAMLGSEFRAFDPNQGNYILEGSATTNIAGLDVGGVFYHQSRHLSDRGKRQAVDWNMIGGRVQKTVTRDGTRLAGRVDLRKVIQHSYVDYDWELDANVTARYALPASWGLFASADLRHLGVDGTRIRGGQTGSRGEGGVRFDGRGGALELYLAVERRLDAYQLDFATETWFGVGMRLLSR